MTKKNHQKKNIKPEIISGKEKFTYLKKILQGKNTLVISTKGFKKRKIFNDFFKNLNELDLDFFYDIEPNPDIDDLDTIKKNFIDKNYKAMIALGGGSVLDSAKILAASLNSENSLSDLFRKKIKNYSKRTIKLIVIPTTSGTGSEVTPFATLWDKRKGKKYSMEGESMYPDYLIMEPKFTLSLPREHTLYPALDTISHSLESIWNKNSTNTSRDYAYQALGILKTALPIVLSNPGNLKARTSMQEASYLAGKAISQNKTAIAHSISYPLTSRFSVPHGLACSFTLVSIIKFLETERKKFFARPDLINDIKDLLSDLNLSNELMKFISRKDTLSLIDEMYSPERARNFILKIDKNDIKKLLTSSL